MPEVKEFWTWVRGRNGTPIQVPSSYPRVVTYKVLFLDYDEDTGIKWESAPHRYINCCPSHVRKVLDLGREWSVRPTGLDAKGILFKIEGRWIKALPVLDYKLMDLPDEVLTDRFNALRHAGVL